MSAMSAALALALCRARHFDLLLMYLITRRIRVGVPFRLERPDLAADDDGRI